MECVRVVAEARAPRRLTQHSDMRKVQISARIIETSTACTTPHAIKKTRHTPTGAHMDPTVKQGGVNKITSRPTQVLPQQQTRRRSEAATAFMPQREVLCSTNGVTHSCGRCATHHCGTLVCVPQHLFPPAGDNRSRVAIPAPCTYSPVPTVCFAGRDGIPSGSLGRSSCPP